MGKALMPNLPQLHESAIDDDDEGDDSSRLRPVNIDALKDFMIKKVNKIAASGAAAEAAPPPPAPSGNYPLSLSLSHTHTYICIYMYIYVYILYVF
jgi:hypothetical protein